eukprot:CAMPEP_0202898880 /NCGR_PEP_ID=MMETSP1392-20130828/7280_1 /ASSEMBLY_ACC=CAM_ASM_000868 /TAXON_ID=225041 /ORGANISM="Chlamydomonas chlamydogama, Strain SAG 11-48b" /LENGTH=681 /DNA_ID=CAMNT_0049584935 /DNA_START=125 /DNA_END=2170 /DNA_ORIENTATION=+
MEPEQDGRQVKRQRAEDEQANGAAPQQDAPVAMEVADDTAKVVDAPKAAAPAPLSNNKAKKEGRKANKENAKDPARSRCQQLTRDIHQSAKDNNLKKAMILFEEAQQEAVKLPQSVFNTLMYLACGGNEWETYARGSQPSNAQSGEAFPTREECIAAADTLWAHMQGANIPAENTTYMALARIEAIKGNPEQALAWAETSISKAQPVQLRLFHPALVGYCLKGDVAAALALDARICQLKLEHLDYGEYEFARLLEVLAKAGSWEQWTGVLFRMRDELNQLSPSTLDIIRSYFESERATEVFGPSTINQPPTNPTEPAAVETQPPPKRKRGRPRKQPQAAPPAAEAAAGAAGQAPAAGEAAVAAAAGAASNGAAARGGASGGLSSAASDGGSSGSSGSVTSGEEAGGRADGTATASSSGTAGGGPKYVAGAARWRVTSGVEVDAKGFSAAAGACLKVVDLEEAEWTSFAAGIASLAIKQELRKDEFARYMEWFDRNGPFDVLVDGANVAFYGQNRPSGGFCWKQIMSMMELARAKHPGARVLLMLHLKRIQDPEAAKPEVQAFLEHLKSQRAFYYTPPGSNDDWYWLYATVKAKHKGLLISNDELRDHIFSLLRPKHFLKWKSRHIVHYSFTPEGVPSLVYPAAFTQCVQELENGSWMFPGQDGTWLCATPVAEGAEGKVAE